ncbi:sLEI family protein [Clostridium sp. CAG:768]|uniref:tetratricopeptide repeat protein n=1 Tax=Candidatus Stercorousia sp. TaxID=3048886 RepID=UPI00033F62DF|nr:sLEI family protein [Clostridium sp. CAG:768]
MSLQTAEQFEENEQYTQAFEEYKKLYERNPKDLSLLERLGHLSMLLDNKEEAAKYYSEILESDATNVLAYEQLMDIYVSTDKYKYYIYRGNMHTVEHKLEHAINDYKKAINCAQEDKDIISARFVLGTLYEQEGNNVKAIDEYLKVIEHEDSHEEVYIRLANLYVKEDAIPSAIDVLERGRKAGFDKTNLKEQLADLYLKNGNPEKAIEITSDELTKVKCLLDMDKKSEAFEKLQKMEGQYNHIPQFYSLKAQYYYMTKDFDKALECVEEFDKYEKNSPLTYQMRALIYEEKNEDYNSYLNWGKYNLVRGNKDIAINEFLNANQIKDDDINLLNTLAMLLEESGDKNHAMEFYEKISKLDETDKKSLQKLAEFRESIGDYKSQAEYLLKLYHLDKRNSTTVRQLGEAYEKLRNKPAAVECYEKYLEIGKGNPDYSKIQHKLEKLQNTEMQEEEGFIDKIMKWFNKN